MFDRIETLQGAVVQHGQQNNRVYLMKHSSRGAERDLLTLETLALVNGYSKIFAKIPDSWKQVFLQDGYIQEGYIPRYFDSEDCLFMGKFLNPRRKAQTEKTIRRIEAVLVKARAQRVENKIDIPEGFTLRTLKKADAPALASLYRRVFESYPFPIHDPDYLSKTMEEHILYFGYFDKDQLIAASSAEMDKDRRSAELTDFATLPEARGKGLAQQLLQTMEMEMRLQKISTLYTIARALSYGMNICFAKGGYTWSGTLINNTDICGNLESMNIWYKQGY